MVSSDQVTQNTALILPLASQNQLHDPSPYLPAIRQAVQATSESISIVFHGDYIQKISPTATWQPMQAFLGIVYGAAAQEAARLDRILMDVDVYLQGFTGEKELDDGVEDRLQKASKVFVAGDDNNLVRSIGLEETDYRLQRLPALASFQFVNNISDDQLDAHLPPRFPVTALGGTFDHLHAGHKVLLSMAVFVTSRMLIVGMSDDPLLVSKSNADLLEPISVRSTRVRDFLRLQNPRLEYDVVAIQDVYGPTAWDADVQALVVSRESIAGGNMIDEERARKSLPALHHLVIDVISSSSSTLDTAGSITSLSHETDASVLKELKMGSTYIRQWLARQRQEQEAKQ